MIDHLSHFHGGLVLRHHKKISCDKVMQKAEMPEQIIISLKANRGHSSHPSVEIGDKVLKGQVLATPLHPLGTMVHAPTSGQITDISSRPTASPDAIMAPCITLIPDGLDEWLSKPEQPLPDSREDVIKLIQEAGIIGMGGAGFPAHVKYEFPANRINQTAQQLPQICTTLIINGAECEPYISCDERLMLDETTAIIKGSYWLQKAAAAEQVIIAIEDNLGGVKQQLESAIKAQGIDCMRVIKVPTIYPTGGEKQLIKVITGHEVASGQTPLSLGIIMQNVATAKAAYDAIELNTPLLERVVTVTGDCIENPQNFLALIGTPFSHLLALAGCRTETVDKLIIGGPMMGYSMPSDDIGIDKTTNCLLALPKDCTKPDIEAMPCIRCGDCVKVCPQELLPQQLLWYINGNDQNHDLEKARDHHVFDCIECGACSWVCPSHINLVDFYRFAKSELTYLDHKQNKAQMAKQRHDNRAERLDRIKAERQAKRRRKTSKLVDEKSAKKEISAVLARIKLQNKTDDKEQGVVDE